MPRDRAVFLTSSRPDVLGLLYGKKIRLSPGTASFNISSRLPETISLAGVMPVILPPGAETSATNPLPTGSETLMKSIGVSEPASSAPICAPFAAPMPIPTKRCTRSFNISFVMSAYSRSPPWILVKYLYSTFFPS